MMLIGLILNLVFAANDKCIQEHVKIPFPDMNLEYVRTSPDGKYLIVTDTEKDKVYLYEVVREGDKFSLRKYDTPLKNEAYPVEPDWEFVSSPYHEGGTQYFRLSDLIQLQDKAPSIYKETGLNEFYHSIGGDKDGFTVVSWTRLQAQKYKVENKEIQTEGELFNICPNLMELPENLKKYQPWIRDRYSIVSGIIEDFGDRKDQRDTGDKIKASISTCIKSISEFGQDCVMKAASDKKATEACMAQVEERVAACKNQVLERMKAEILAKVSKDKISSEDIDTYFLLNDFFTSEKSSFHVLINPILSKDRKHIAGLYAGSTKIYSVGPSGYCTFEKDLKAQTGKVSFSHPENGKTRYVTYSEEQYDEASSTDVETVRIYDLEKDKSYTIASGGVSYSNLTKDGRVIYVEGETLNIVDAQKRMHGTCIKDTQASTSETQKPAAQ